MKVLGGDGSQWLKDIMEDEAMPKFQSGIDQRAQRAESRLHHARWEAAPDMHPVLWALIPLFLIGLWVVAL